MSPSGLRAPPGTRTPPVLVQGGGCPVGGGEAGGTATVLVLTWASVSFPAACPRALTSSCFPSPRALPGRDAFHPEREVTLEDRLQGEARAKPQNHRGRETRVLGGRWPGSQDAREDHTEARTECLGCAHPERC